MQADTKKQFYTCDNQERLGGTQCMCPTIRVTSRAGHCPSSACTQFAMDPARFMQQIKMSGTDLKRKD